MIAGMQREHDVFICHASEDKDAIVRPLAQALAARGLRVWFDEFSIGLGDGIRKAIDHGLATSRFGVVVLSPAFFGKGWTDLELEGLFARKGSGEMNILPVWHGVDAAEVRALSPLLGGIKAVSTAIGIQQVADAIRRRTGVTPDVVPETYTYQFVSRVMGVPDLPIVGYDIRDAYFERCTINGPVIFLIQGSDFALINCSIESVSIFWPLEYGRAYIGAIGARNLAFVDCRFDNVGIAGGRQLIDRLVQGYANAPSPATREQIGNPIPPPGPY